MFWIATSIAEASGNSPSSGEATIATNDDNNIIDFPSRQRMNLERLEALCIAYLKQAKHPIVPVSVLLEYCQREEECRKLDTSDLLAFLRRHVEVHVLEGPSDEEDLRAELFAAAGLDMGPRAVLRSRIPTRREQMAMMKAQLDDMEEQLAQQLAQARENGEGQQAVQIEVTLGRVATMRERLKKHW